MSRILDADDGTDIGVLAAAAALKTAINWDWVTPTVPTQSSSAVTRRAVILVATSSLVVKDWAKLATVVARSLSWWAGCLTAKMMSGMNFVVVAGWAKIASNCNQRTEGLLSVDG